MAGGWRSAPEPASHSSRRPSDDAGSLALPARASGFSRLAVTLQPQLTSPESLLEFSDSDQEVVRFALEGRPDPPRAVSVHLQAQRLARIQGFEELLCLPLLREVQRLPHQERTALTVLRRFRGRAVLGDEVGLGKTIEAALVLKEYVMRGLVRRALVLCPPSLVQQWQEELRDKFGLDSLATSDPEFRSLGEEAWSGRDLVVASLGMARMPRHREALRRTPFDLLIVDEAHHLRHRNSAAWRLVSEIPRKFLLLLTATPVQNDLEELYNLITLLRPGQLGTPAEFRRRFVDVADRRRPRHVTALRELMMDVMVRNTRAQVTVQLPPRQARTIRVQPDPEEAEVLSFVASLVRREWGRKGLSVSALTSLQLQAASSPLAVAEALRKRGHLEMARQAESLGAGAKGRALETLLRRLDGPALVFTRSSRTAGALVGQLREAGLKVFRYTGDLDPASREAELRRFTSEGGVLVLTEVGSEGKNLQFCRNLVNFDLPWNPMRIEQRVGRLHRLGQTGTIQVFNLCLTGSLEDHLLTILDEKLNMFELVVGEIEMILGPLEEEGDLEDMLMEMVASAEGPQDLAARMQALGERMEGLRRDYQANQEYDQTLFGDEFRVEEA